MINTLFYCYKFLPGVIIPIYKYPIFYECFEGVVNGVSIYFKYNISKLVYNMKNPTIIETLPIMIDEPFTKKGYGFQSLSLLEEEARKLGIEKLVLEVRTDNTSAVSLYKKFGFNLKYTEAIMEKKI